LATVSVITRLKSFGLGMLLAIYNTSLISFIRSFGYGRTDKIWSLVVHCLW